MTATQALAGMAAGVQVLQGSGRPNSEGFGINIRGIGTLNNASPLVLVDGMEMDLSTVNPNDIESVQFLKDAAATSIYGARAANGVMYVTTKRGRTETRPSINVRAQYAVSSLANTDYFDQLMSGPELLRYYEETGIYTPQEVATFKEKYFKETDFQWYKYIYQ